MPYKRKRIRSYPRRRYRRFRKGKAPIPLLPTLPAVYAGLIDPVSNAMPAIQSGDLMGGVQRFIDRLSENFMGFYITQPQAGFIGIQRPLQTYGAIIGGYFGHKLANAVGVNRYMKKIPLLGKYFQL